jgi:Ca2+-binding RTX toxin-like protein
MKHFSNAARTLHHSLDSAAGGGGTGSVVLGSAGNDSLTGTAGDDSILGFAGNDTLNGGAGADTLVGGDGNDTYVVGNEHDHVTEKSAGGTDKVLASVSYSLGANVENLTLTGNAAINGAGNAVANTIIGNSAANVIDGRGGLDHLDGGAGNDVYVIHSAGEHQAAEISDSGHLDLDEVRFAGTKAGRLTLFAGDTGIEEVVFGTGLGAQANTSGTVALSLDASLAPNALVVTGNNGANTVFGTAFADFIFGAGGNDKLSGGGGDDTLIGGTGLDTLAGGTGTDTFWFDATPAAGTVLTCTDFTSGTDKFRVTKADLAGLTSTNGAITSAQFFSSSSATAAHDADDRFVFNTSTGALYYDADGSGGAAAVKIAVIGTHTLLASDIVVV